MTVTALILRSSVVLIAGLVVLATALGYIAISVGEDAVNGGNYVFLVIMLAVVAVAVVANVMHPIAWTIEEQWFAVGLPAVLGAVAIVYGLAKGDAARPIALGPLEATPVELGMLALLAAGAVWAGFVVFGRLGFGPMAAVPDPDDPVAILEPPAEAPTGWLRLGSGAQRSAMRDLSRWMWVSIRPAQQKQPSASYVGASASMRSSIAAIRPPANAISTRRPSVARGRRALRMTKSSMGTSAFVLPQKNAGHPGCQTWPVSLSPLPREVQTWYGSCLEQRCSTSSAVTAAPTSASGP